MLTAKRIAGALLALVLLAGIPLVAPSAMAADAPCAEAEDGASGIGCCDAGADAVCSLDCAAGGAAIPLVSPRAVSTPQRGGPLAIQCFTAASYSGPPETAPPKAS